MRPLPTESSVEGALSLEGAAYLRPVGERGHLAPTTRDN